MTLARAAIANGRWPHPVPTFSTWRRIARIRLPARRFRAFVRRIRRVLSRARRESERISPGVSRSRSRSGRFRSSSRRRRFPVRRRQRRLGGASLPQRRRRPAAGRRRGRQTVRAPWGWSVRLERTRNLPAEGPYSIRPRNLHSGSPHLLERTCRSGVWPTGSLPLHAKYFRIGTTRFALSWPYRVGG
jgi:hypothetical protein